MRKEHSAKLHILKALSDGDFHSGEALGQELGISRAAIAKHIKGLSDWGVDIYRIQGRGYQLAQPLQLLDEQRLQAYVDTQLELISVIDSTNQYLLEKVDDSDKGRVCLAEYQAKEEDDVVANGYRLLELTCICRCTGVWMLVWQRLWG